MDADNRKTIMLYVTNNIGSIAFKTLQRDEQERSDSEKIAYMEELLVTNPSLFLTKWGRYLPVEQLEHFQSLRGKLCQHKYFLCANIE